MNKLLKIHAMESEENINSISPVTPDELPQMEQSFRSTVEVDSEVQTHLVHLESLEDIIADVKDVVEQQKINLSEIKEENGLDEKEENEESSTEGSGGSEGSDGSSDGGTEGGDESVEGGESGDVSIEGGEGGSDESSDGGVENDGGEPQESSEGSSDPEASDGGDIDIDTETSADGETPEEGESSDENPESSETDGGDENAEPTQEGEEDSKSEESDESEDEGEEKEPDLDKDSTDEEVEGQVAQESLMLANYAGRLGIAFSIKDKPNLESIYSALQIKKKPVVNMESFSGVKNKRYALYNTSHESFLEVLSNFTAAAKDGVKELVTKIIEFFKKLLSNIVNISKTAKEESKILGKIMGDGYVVTTKGNKIPLSDIKMNLIQDIVEKGIDVNILSGVDLVSLLHNEQLLVHEVIATVHDMRAPGYVKDGQWAQHLISRLMNAGLKKLSYADHIKGDVYFLGSSCGYCFRTDKFGGYHIEEVYPENKTDVQYTADKVISCAEHAVLCLPVLNNVDNKKNIVDCTTFLEMLTTDFNYLHTSREIVKLVRSLQSRQLATLTSVRKIRATILRLAEELDNKENNQ